MTLRWQKQIYYIINYIILALNEENQFVKSMGNQRSPKRPTHIRRGGRNQVVIRYILKCFPTTSLWSFIVDVFKISNDLFNVKIDELFSEFKLYEQQVNHIAKDKGSAPVAEKKRNSTSKKDKATSSSKSMNYLDFDKSQR